MFLPKMMKRETAKLSRADRVQGSFSSWATRGTSKVYNNTQRI